ncbi:MAG: hypothetical protein Q4G29_00845 [Pseudoscardovia radai]|nr:hypothetical protein [Pseudoscardovia radai]
MTDNQGWNFDPSTGVPRNPGAAAPVPQQYMPQAAAPQQYAQPVAQAAQTAAADPYAQGQYQQGQYAQDAYQSGAYQQGQAYDSAASASYGAAPQYDAQQPGAPGASYGAAGTYGQPDASAQPTQAYQTMALFDPATGLPIASQPDTDQEPAKRGMSRPARIVTLIAAIVVVALVAGFVGYKIGSRKTRGQELVEGLTAALSSVEEGQLGKDMHLDKILANRTADLGFSGTIDSDGTSGTLDASYSYDLKAKRHSLNGTVNFGGFTTNATLYGDDSRATLSVPALYSRPITYDYAHGSLSQSVANTFDIDSSNETKAVGDSFGLASPMLFVEVADALSQLLTATETNLDKLTWSKADKKDLEVNGKTVGCSGYTAQVTASDLSAWLGTYSDALTGIVQSDTVFTDAMLQEMYDVSGKADVIARLQAAIASAKQELADVHGSATLTYYVKGGQLAMLAVSASDGPSYEIDFKGGDFAMQNCTITYTDGDDSQTLKWSGSTNGGTETWTASFPPDNAGYGYSYDSSNGTLTLTSFDGYDTQSISGTTKTDGNTFTFTVPHVEPDSDVSIDNMAISISPDASIKTVDASNALDLSTATSSDLEDLQQQVQRAADQLE